MTQVTGHCMLCCSQGLAQGEPQGCSPMQCTLVTLELCSVQPGQLYAEGLDAL